MRIAIMNYLRRIGWILLGCCWGWLHPAPVYAACATPVFINEFHYDNVGEDVDEFIEIAGPAGTDLAHWSVVLYNGSDGHPYGAPIPLSGTLADEGNGYGALAFPAGTLQNGAPDGFALLDPNGVVQQFLSYEGSLTAASGPALGLTSVDVGVSETTATPQGHSLQLTGAGLCAADLYWAGPFPASPGMLNAGQLLSRAPQVVATTPAANAYDVALDAALVITFSTDIALTGSASLVCEQSGASLVAPQLVSARAISLPHAPFRGGEHCTVTLPAGLVHDPIDPSQMLPGDYQWHFTAGYPAVSGATLFISPEEGHDRAIVDAQDDAWRGAVQTAQQCSIFQTGAIHEVTAAHCGSQTGDCVVPTTFPTGLTITYTLRNMDGPLLGSADAWASGQADGCGEGATLQDGAPRPSALPGCYYNDSLRGSSSYANGLLFSFSEPLSAFGGWFGDLESKPTGTAYYAAGRDGGTGIGGALAYLRLFFEDGTMQESPILPTRAPAGPWTLAETPPPSFALDAGGNVAYCGGPNQGDPVGCGNQTTRWIGFVADNPAKRVVKFLVTVGDDDHSGAGPSDGPNVSCAGGDAQSCNSGTESLSFIGPTICVAPDLALHKHVQPTLVRAGEVVTYTLTYTNQIAGMAATAIELHDSLPSGLTYLTTLAADPPATVMTDPLRWQIDTLPPGARGVITFTAQVASAAAGWLTNTASINIAGELNPTDNQAQATLFVAQPRLAVQLLLNQQPTEIAPGPELVSGTPIHWRYTLTNTGNVPMTNLVLRDEQGAPLLCQEGPFPALWAIGEQVVCTVEQAAAFGAVSITTQVTANIPALNHEPVVASVLGHYVGINPPPTPTNTPTAEPATVTPSPTVTPEPATVTPSPTVTPEINTPMATPSPTMPEATPTATMALPSPTSSPISPPLPSATPTAPEPQPPTAPVLEFHKTVNQSQLIAAPASGQILTYTLSYHNRGDMVVTGVEIIEEVPAFTSFWPEGSSPGWDCPVPAAGEAARCHWWIGDLPPGASGSVTFAVMLATLPDNTYRLENRATLSAHDGSQIAEARVTWLASVAVEVIMAPTSSPISAEPTTISHYVWLPTVLR